MKTFLKFLTFVTLLSASSNFLSAQTSRINLYSAYTFDDELETITNNNNYFKGTLKGGYQWGAGFEYLLKSSYGLELAYYRQDSDFPVEFSTSGANNDSNRAFGVGMNFIMLGGNRYVPVSGGKVFPFGGLMLGMAIIENKDPLPGAESSSTNFAWGGKAGVFFSFSKNVGLKLHMQLLSAVQSFGGGVYLGTSGAGAGLDTQSSMYQFGAGGALVIIF